MIRASIIISGPALFLLLAACTSPFDADAPWRPMQDREGYSYLSHGEGRYSSAGSGPLAEFQGTAPEVNPLAENPWAQPGRSRVALCYSDWLDDEAEVLAEAARLCPAPARVELESRSVLQNNCPLLQPRRATFRCLGPGEEIDEGGPGEARDES